MIDAIKLVGTVFSESSELVIEGVEDAGDVIVVRARTRGGAAAARTAAHRRRETMAIRSGRRPTFPLTAGVSW
jgi:hypothetical protein